MKLKHIFIAVSMTTVGAMTSCSLDEKIESFVEPDNYYLNVTQCESALNSCYHPLKTIYDYQMMLATECVTDLAWAASGTQDAQLDITPATPRHGSTVWTYGYRGVMYCNAAIDGITKAPIKESERTRLLGEGKVMRAYYYYLLTSFFGDVPYYTVNVSDEKIMTEVAHLPRMSAVETRNSIIEDLLEILPQMEQVRTSDIPANRSGAAMGWMLVAKMAMWNHEWEIALDAIEALENIYGDLNQYPLSDIPFRFKNTPESIFEIQHTYTEGGVNYSSRVAAICMPYTKKTGTALYDGVEIPELGVNATAWSPMRPTPFFSGSLLYKGTKDLRDPMTLLHESYNGQKFSTSGAQWLSHKFWCFNMSNTYDSNNYKIFRYADALLMKAECYMNLEDAENAVKYLNMTRERAGLDPYVFRNWTKFMPELMDERARELFGEFQRKFDLVRWGVWYERVRAFTNYQQVLDNIKPCHEYYPIPDKEVVYSGYALDNNAYKQCGL